MVFAQRDTKWKNIILGFGTGTIGAYGCTLSSFTMCLYDSGYVELTPKIVNDALKAVGAFAAPRTAPNEKNLMNWGMLAKAYPQVTYRQDLSADYPSVAAPIDKLKTYVDQGLLVILRVSAKGIGGTGDHFVKVKSVDASGLVMIQDPWWNEEVDLRKRYTVGSIDTAAEIILGFRIMEIKKKIDEGASMDKFKQWFDKFYETMRNKINEIEIGDDKMKSYDEISNDPNSAERMINATILYKNGKLAEISGLQDAFKRLQDQTVPKATYDAVVIDNKGLTEKIEKELKPAIADLTVQLTAAQNAPIATLTLADVVNILIQKIMQAFGKIQIKKEDKQ